MNIADELAKLQQLHQTGGLSDEEYARAKAAVLDRQLPAAVPLLDPVAAEQQTRQWAMFLHLSLLAGFVVPLAGLVLPIVIWQLKKTELPELDVHGKIVVNWIISAIIYAFGCVILSFLIIGIPLLIGLAIVAVVFPVIGAVKANNGEVWRYPLSLTFVS